MAECAGNYTTACMARAGSAVSLAEQSSRHTSVMSAKSELIVRLAIQPSRRGTAHPDHVLQILRIHRRMQQNRCIPPVKSRMEKVSAISQTTSLEAVSSAGTLPLAHL